MTVETLATFFGWMAVINILYLVIATLLLTMMKDWVSGVHQRLLGLEKKDATLAYFNWLGNYKIFTMIFSIVPYIALRLM